MPGRDPAAGAADRFLSKAAAHRDAGRLDKARRDIGRALDIAPDHAAARYEMGMLVFRTEGPGPAVPHFAAALKAAPDRATSWVALASALLESGRTSDARAIAERFRAQGLPGNTAAALDTLVERAVQLGRAQYDAQDFAAAEGFLDLAIALDETHADATFLAAAVAARTNRLPLAYDLFSIAIFRDPGKAVYFAGLGALLTVMDDEAAAISALERAVALDPDLAIAHANLAGCLHKRSSYALALSHADRAIAIDPNCLCAHINRGVILKSLGRLHEAIACYDRAIVAAPHDVDSHSNRLFAKLYAGDIPPEEYAADARTFGRRFADHLLRTRPFAHDRDPGRRLRIGFLSGDLFGHPIARFLEPFLRHVDRTQFEARAYMTRATEDGVSKILHPLFDAWRNVAGLGDDALADLIEADGIDILVDLSGYSAGHRLLVFARRPAPVQVTWMGHPATTGLAAMDYRLTDTVQDDEASDSLHTEVLWRLPRVSATYQVLDGLPPVRERAPFEDNGHVTFGMLNRFEKVSDAALETWARILAGVPGARLFLVVGDIDTPEIRAQVEMRLARAGIALDRVRLQPRVRTGYFELYHQVDIALDPFPYNGGTTSNDTLAMGVPFVTLRGATAVGRGGAIVLCAVGLDELVADSPQDYAAIAIALATDPERLRAIRSGLRERLLASPMTDHARLADEVGRAFRAMWARWATGEPRAQPGSDSCARG